MFLLRLLRLLLRSGCCVFCCCCCSLCFVQIRPHVFYSMHKLFQFFLADCPTELRPTLNLCGLQRLLRNCHAGFPRVQWVRLNKKSPPCFAHDIVALDTGVAPKRLHKTSCAFVSRHLTQVQMVMFCFSKFLSPHVCHG